MLFKDNYLFGVGLKNYGVECDLQVVRPLHEAQFCSSLLVLELLGETRLIGISIFFIFLVYFIKFSNYLEFI